MTPEHKCLHEEQIQGISRKTAELEAKNGFKEQRINELITDQKRMEEKIDVIADNVNKLMLQSVKDDNNLELRLKTIETKLAIQTEKRIDDHNSTMRRIAYWGIVLTIITIIINILFHILPI